MGVAIVAACAVVVLLLVGVLVALSRARTESRRRLAAAHQETTDLRERVQALSRSLETSQETMITRAEVADQAFLITDAGQPRPEPNVPDRVVLSATLGEPLVKVMAFAHGLGRALSPESRNRIWFEMRREVRASRRRRRRDLKAFVREARAAERARDGDHDRDADAA